jgi:hypothetical protein
MLRHCGSDKLKKKATIHNSKLNSEFKAYEQFAIAKYRQKKFNKFWKDRSQVFG